MKIGIFTPYLDTLTGGEKYMLTLAWCLSQEHDIFFFWDDKTILERAEKKFNMDFSKITLTSNIFSPTIPFFQRLKQTKNYDAIIYLSDGSLPLTLTKKLLIHFQFPVEWVKANTFINKLKFARVYNTFCNSQFTKQYIDKKFHTDSKVIYPPIEAPVGDNEKKENIIFTVGRYGYLSNGSNYKKHDIMIEAFKKMVDNGFKNWKFVIAVSYFEKDGKHIEKFKEMAKGYPIVFLENKSFPDLQTYYQKAKIYWHAAGFGEDIKNHPDYAEHFGMSTVEAMSYGVVPVVINLGGQSEIVMNGENGMLWDTIDELIEETKQVASNPGLQNSLAKKAKERAKDFTVEKFRSGVYALLQ